MKTSFLTNFPNLGREAGCVCLFAGKRPVGTFDFASFRASRGILDRFFGFVPFLLVVVTAAIPCRANSGVYQKTLPGTAWILTSETMGSGVLLSVRDRLVLTNQHVVGDESEVRVVFPFYDKGRCRAERQYYVNHLENLAILGKVVARDAERDLALVRVTSLPKHVHEIELGKPVQPGDDVHSVGNPGASDALWIYTYGKVRSVYYKAFRGPTPHRMEVVEMTSPINRGDSGGPIVNNRGQLVAISQSYLVAGRLVSYGVNVSEISWFLSKARRGSSTACSSSAPPTEMTHAKLAAGFRVVPAND